MTTCILRGAPARTLACALLATTCLAAPAVAQLSGPPTYRSFDANGVDLVRGEYMFSFVEGSIGSGAGALTLERRVGSAAGGASQWDGITFAKTRPYAGGPETVTIMFGNIGERFTSSGGGYSSSLGKGSSLTGGGSYFVYRLSDGTTITFADPSGNPQSGTTNLCKDYAQTTCRLTPTEIASPDGSAVTLQWGLNERCASWYNNDGSLDCEYDWRLAGVSNSYGRSLAFSYATDLVNGYPSNDWYKRTGASFDGAASVSYAYLPDGAVDVTDLGGRVWRVAGGAIRRPGASGNSLRASGTSGSNLTIVNEGVATSYARSVSGSTATMTVTNALNQQSVVVSDLTIGRPTSIKDPLNRTTSFQYDANGRLTRTTLPEGNYVQLTLDARGNLTQTQAVAKAGSGAAAITSSAAFPASCANVKTCNQPTSTTDARGNVTNYEYDPTHGGVLSVTSPAQPNGIRPQTRYGYTLIDGEYQLTSVSACRTTASCAGTADEVKTTVAYDAAGNVTSTSSGAGDGSLTATSTMTYDGFGNLLTLDGPLPGSADTTHNLHNGARQLIGTISPDPDGAGPLKHRAVKNSYTHGLLTKVERGTVNGLSGADWTAFALLEAAETGWDANARPVTTKLVAGGTTHALTQTSYDALGRPECTALRMNPAAFGAPPASACTLGSAGSFGPDRIAKAVYDAAGQVTQQRVAVGTADEAAEVSSTYRPNGQVETLTDAENNRTTYVYDGHDRLSQTFFPVPTKGALQSSTTDYEQLTYDAGSNVVSQRVRDGRTIGLSYDALDRLTLKDTPNDVTADRDVSYAYDNLGRLIEAGHWHRYVQLSYDALGRLSRQKSTVGWMDMAYDAAGRMTRIAHPHGEAAKVYDYLATGEVKSISEAGGVVLASFGYDDLGRRTSLTRGNGTATSYGYDGASRLTSLAHDFAGTANDLTLTFSHNPASQITSNTRSNDAYAWTGHGNGSTGLAANGLSQLVSQGAATFTHDLRGNVANDGVKGYGYTIENRMASAGTAALDYNPLGQLNRWSGGPTDIDYVGDRIMRELNGGNLMDRYYVYGPGMDEPIAWYEGNTYSTDRRYFHADERGSIVAISDNAGNVTAINKYDEYGKPQGTLAGRFGYTGQAWLPEVGLYSYKARIYHPVLGRFMQTDPIGYGDGMNLYAYVRNDPVNLVDPTGLTVTCGSLNKEGECENIIITAEKGGGGGGGYTGNAGAMLGGSGNSANGSTGESGGGPEMVASAASIPQAVPRKIPGGPYKAKPAVPGNKAGSFQGPKQPKGPRSQAQWVPPESQGGPRGSRGYWKVYLPGEASRWYSRSGRLITSGQAHPNPLSSTKSFFFLGPIGAALCVVFCETPAY